MLWSVLRWITGVALRWFYREVEVVGLERLPRDGPVVLAVNHPNALVDALVAAWIAPRRVRLTGKAVLFDNPLLAPLLRAVGFVPLRRASDERARRSGRATADAPPDGARNADAFRSIVEALGRKEAILIFPEGKSHSDPQLAPLKTGAARMALQARDERGIPGVRLVPLGLVFEQKDQPRSRVLAQVGEAIDLDSWRGAGERASAEALTAELDRRLRAVTLNFESADEARQVLGVAGALAGALDEARPVATAEAPLANAVDVAQRIARVRDAVLRDPALATRASGLLERIDAVHAITDARGIALHDARIETTVAPALRFVVREGTLVMLGAPVALWGRLNSVLPLRLARWLARRSARHADEPAMHTIVIGLALVLLAYAVQTTIVWSLTSAPVAMAYLVSLPPATTWDFRFSDRVRRARRRMRAYLTLRSRPELRRWLDDELAWIREEAVALEALGAGASLHSHPGAVSARTSAGSEESSASA